MRLSAFPMFHFGYTNHDIFFENLGNTRFDHWYNQNLKDEIYPQYRSVETTKQALNCSNRIAFHVSFDDYSNDELCDVPRLISQKKGLHFTDDTCRKLEPVFSSAQGQEDFGNGGYVRNIIEKAQMAQATRLL